MPHQLRLFCIALQFLTRVPVPRAVGFEPAWLNASARWFPAVGTGVGAVAALVIWAASLAFPLAVAAMLSIIATLLLTGAFHEDGLADTCDALGGAVNRARALEIMKDSRIGSYGAVALVAALGLKATLLAALPLALALPASVFAHTASRAAPVLLIRALAYAGDVGAAKAKPLAQRVGADDLGVALVWVVALGMLLIALRPGFWLPLAASAIGLALVTETARRWLRKRLGGYTGDTLGATQQVAELGVLLVWLGTARWAV